MATRCKLLLTLALQKKREIVFSLLIILPVSRDGPLDINIWKWKFCFVSVFLLISLSARNRVITSFPYAKSVVLLGMCTLLTVVAYILSETPELSINQTLTFMTSVFFFVSLCRLFNNSLLRTGIISIVVITVVACLLTFLQYAIIRFHLSFPVLLHLITPEMNANFFEQGNRLDWRGIRLSSFFFHSNQLGHFLSVSFGFLFPLLLYSKTTRTSLFYLLTLTLVVLCIFLTQSRGALFIVFVAATITVFFNRSICWKRHIGLLTLLLLGGLLAMILLGSNFTNFMDRITSLDISSREKNWSYALKLIPDHFLFGVGPGCSSFHILNNFPMIQYEHMLNRYWTRQPFDYWSSHPHNYYLNTLLEVGVFSLIMQLMLFGSAVVMGVRLVIISRHSLHKALALGATIVLITEFIYGIFESYSFFGASETGALISFSFALLLYLSSQYTSRVFAE